MKYFKTIICLLLIILTLTACLSPKWEKLHPTQYPGSYWESEDGKISFIIASQTNYDGIYFNNGNIYHDDTNIEMIFIMALSSNGICAITSEQFDYELLRENIIECPEQWVICKIEKDMFIIETERTDFFSEGERIIFRKVSK